MKGKGYIIIIGIILIVIIGKACGLGEQDEIDEVGSSIDWGVGYYWDSSTHQVEETIW